MNRPYTVFSLKLANKLVNKGFEILDTGVNVKNPKYRVFFFEDTEALRKAINEING